MDENKWIELSQQLEVENTKLRELLSRCVGEGNLSVELGTEIEEELEK